MEGRFIIARTQCGNCGHHSFQMSEVSPSGGNFKYFFIQCSSCGVPVTAVEFSYVSALIEGLERRLSSIEARLR